MTPLERIKKATVALVLLKESEEGHPFTIIGSGFCIDRQGVVVTCSHVLSSLMKEPWQQAHQRVKKGEWDEAPGFDIETVTPYVMFFKSRSREELMGVLVRPTTAVAKTTHDIAMLRLQSHSGFPAGFPYVEIAPYPEVTEGSEVGACGFPLGNFLQKQVGTVTASFTKGIVSAIIPNTHVHLDYLQGFQLNLFATHGSSGGPVFLYSSGKVFGAVESDVVDRNGRPLPGLTKAAPIYPMIENDAVSRLLSAEPPQQPR